MARPKKSPTSSLIEARLPEPSALPGPLPDQFMRDMTYYPNGADAKDIVAEHYRKVWSATEHGLELEALTHELEAYADLLAAMGLINRNYCDQLVHTGRFETREPDTSTANKE